MIRFERIVMRNFLSFGNEETEIRLDRPGITVIIGENKDTPVLSRNGCGKSAIIDAVSYAIFGKSMRGIANRNLPNKLRRKGQPMVVTLDFRVEGRRYRIIRGESPSVLKVYSTEGDGEFREENEITRNKKETTEDVSNLLGMDMEVFSRVVINTTEKPSYMTLPLKGRREIIEKLFGLAVLAEKAERIKEKRKELAVEIAREEERVLAETRRRDSMIDLLEAERKRAEEWRENRDREIAFITEKLDHMRELDLDNLKKLQQEAGKLKEEIDNLRIQRERIVRGMETVRADGQKHRLEMNQLTNNINKMVSQAELMSQSVCPTCRQRWENWREEYEKLYAEATKFSERVEKLKEYLAEKRNEYITLKRQLDEVSERMSVLTGEYDGIQNKVVKLLGDRIGEIDLEKHEDEIRGLEARLNHLVASDVNPHEASIADLVNRIPDEIDTSRLDELKSEKENVEYLIYLLTDRKSFLRRRLIGMWTPILNDKLGELLSSFDLPFDIELDDDLSLNIIRNRISYDWGNLSRGQRQRASLAIDFALRHVHALGRNGGSNLLVMDEVLDSGLDETGARQVMDYIRKEKNGPETVFLVTHRMDIAEQADRVMKMVMKNQITMVEDE